MSGSGTTVTGPTIRVVPTPRSEPPSDEELAALGVAAAPAGAPLLPVDLPGSRARRSSRAGGAGHGVAMSEQRDPARVASSRRAPTTGRSLAGTPYPQPEEAALHRARATEAAEVRSATRLMLATCVEVLAGFRPVGQLRGLCSAERFEAIATGLTGRSPVTSTGLARGLGGPSSAAARPIAPPRGRASTAMTSRIAPGERVAVRRVQVCDVAEGVAEVAVVLARRGTVWAMAMRLEHLHDRWLCTFLEVL